MMKKIAVIIFLLISYTGFNQAPKQPPRDFGRLQSLKIAYITNQLNLTPEEATKFWPVYNNYTKEIILTRKEYAKNVIAGDEKILNIKKKYWGDFKNVLGSDERVNKLFLSEREFGNMIRREMESRQRMRQRQQPS